MSLFTATWDVWRALRGGAETIEERQQRRLGELLSFARANSRFYREKYSSVGERVTMLRQLPHVTKQELMERLDDWCTDPALTREGLETFVHDPARIGELYLGKYLVCTTSGTTGAPGIFVQDQRALDIYGALSTARTIPAWLSMREFLRVLRLGGKTAAVWATHGHFMGVSMAKKQVRERPSRAKRLKVFSVLTPLPQLVAELNEYQPVILNGYATMLSILADEQKAGRLQIHPALIITASESIPTTEQQRIKEIFNASLGSQYGASEDLSIAFTCENGSMHVNADWVILEPVDDDYQPVPKGQSSSRVLLTNLANRIQPIIRYELGDRINMSPEPCPCGLPLPTLTIEGRTDDILRLRDPLDRVFAIAPLAIWSVAKETQGVLRFQIIQTEPSCIEVRLEAQPEAQEATWLALRERLAAYLTSQGLPNVLIKQANEPPSRNPQSGKFRSVWMSPEPSPQPPKRIADDLSSLALG